MVMQLMHQRRMAEILGDLGVSEATVVKMLTSIRRSVTSRVMRPGTMSGGIRKLIQLAATNSDVGRNVDMMWVPKRLKTNKL